nr:YetF domain-containing protein [Cytobacillus oceanisediminis]
MNAFDLVVTVALGSTFATIFLNKQVSLAEGLTAYALLIGLQYIVAWLSLHSIKFNKIIKASPDLLYYQGQFIESALNKNRVLKSEIMQAIRSNGFSSMEDVEAVVFETNGSMSVIKRSSSNSKTSTLSDIDPKKS